MRECCVAEPGKSEVGGSNCPQVATAARRAAIGEVNVGPVASSAPDVVHVAVPDKPPRLSPAAAHALLALLRRRGEGLHRAG